MKAARTRAPAARKPAPASAAADLPALAALAAIEAWFAARGWHVFDFQRAAWQAFARGESGLLHASTGSGKTYALWFGALLRELTHPGPRRTGLRVLWITPMRALASDTARALQAPLADLLPGWQVGMRTGDTSSAERARQQKALPACLVTTPESLSLMLSRPDDNPRLRGVDIVIVDEWHEMLGNKRGVQVQLALARLRQWNPALLAWGLSATLGDLGEARDALLGGEPGVTISADLRKDILVDTLCPAQTGRFPWSGHLGLQMLEPVMQEIEKSGSTLVFTNTRSQAELWFQNLLALRPDWAGIIALHHGSLDKSVRDWVEAALKQGSLKAVVCTSSLDLGVDFSPVERVLQVGSCKGVARLLQRAGRSGHAPGQVSRVTLVPTNSLELLEAAAARDAVRRRQVEARHAPGKPLDVLVQHMVTVALGAGFAPDALLQEVRQAWSYRTLQDNEWEWALDFIGRGGQSLVAYPEYRRVLPDETGVLRVADSAVARRHRLGIGTIVSDASIQVKFVTGASIGSVEESFIARLKPGDRFLFGGRTLELVRVHEMNAYVKRATGARGAVPRWQGGRMPLSSELAHAVLERLAQAVAGRYEGPEMQSIRPLLELQQRWSALPQPGVLLAETLASREGRHLFLYPFAGRSVHVGLGALLAWRLARGQAATFSVAVNDYGLELLAPRGIAFDPVAALGTAGLFSSERLLEDVLASLNAGELARRRFREIARISGLVSGGLPGQPKSNRQLQASSGLFYDVFSKHDSGNLLLTQAQREVLEQELELSRLRQALEAMQRARLLHCALPRASPFAFPLMVERMREKLSTEKLSDRVARLLRELEQAAAKEGPA
ncbi:MAG: box helicase [Paucimonas sp.]|nr:box helicase [Paucimonas sp.]